MFRLHRRTTGRDVGRDTHELIDAAAAISITDYDADEELQLPELMDGMLTAEKVNYYQNEASVVDKEGDGVQRQGVDRRSRASSGMFDDMESVKHVSES